SPLILKGLFITKRISGLTPTARRYLPNRSSTFFVIRITAGSFPRSPCDQSVLPTVSTVPPRLYMPSTALPVRPFSHFSYHSQSSGCHRAGQLANTSNDFGVPSRYVGNGNPSFQTSSQPSHS